MIDIWVPGLDPADDPLLAEIADACSRIREIPARVLGWSIEDVAMGNVKGARRRLRGWAKEVGITCDTMRKTDAPVLWSLYQDGWRTVGMPADMPSLPTSEIVDGREASIAHYDEDLFVDFGRKLHYGTSAESWAAFLAFAKENDGNAFVVADVIRRAKHDEPSDDEWRAGEP